jgi:tripartite-type tricarboxylate transporter receptor subunit TctC
VAAFSPTLDLEPIMLVATSQDILIVPPDSKFNTFNDLLTFAKANPMKLTYGTLGSASSGNLAVALLAELTGIRMRQVAYTQSGGITTDIMAGRIDVFMPTTGGHIGNVTSGKERALAVSGRTRAKGLPDVPTFEELGVKMPEGSSWYALFAPKGTPRAIVDKINKDLQAVLATDDMKQREETLGFKLIGGSPEKLAAFLKDESEKWTKLTKTPYFAGQ